MGSVSRIWNKIWLDVGVMTMSVVMADETDDAHRLAVSGRDGYWNCLAREFPRESNKGLSERDFGALIAGACPSERQTSGSR